LSIVATTVLPVDCAVLDYAIVGGNSLAAADALMARGVPFVIASGYDNE
jgi:hypothetical protein